MNNRKRTSKRERGVITEEVLMDNRHHASWKTVEFL